MGRTFTREEIANGRPLEVPAPLFKPSRKAPVLLELDDPPRRAPIPMQRVLVIGAALTIVFCLIALSFRPSPPQDKPLQSDPARAVRERDAHMVEVYRQHLAHFEDLGFLGQSAHARALNATSRDLGIPAETIMATFDKLSGSYDRRLTIAKAYLAGRKAYQARGVVFARAHELAISEVCGAYGVGSDDVHQAIDEFTMPKR